ncbi:Acyl-CoA synthetase short-chain family member 3 [Phytophthora cinnamomi]|uniref:Acyl-CoA synthetase short-chain family member 3 n=1 Tax=Phytophthora cinnamomi TaxID=4785 RepID=UPI0035597055|nr:Acyl-CoA synthetase short-chain family member 3 [Phytophthora cinnamomi]
MASDKRPILSGKRARSRRKRAALRAANVSHPSAPTPTPECDSDEDAKRQQLRALSDSGGNSSDKATSQSENDEEEEDAGLVFVCRPTMPDFCSVFLPRGEEPAYCRARKLQPDCRTFTVHVPTFQETCEGFVTYTLELTTCDEPHHTFQLERRFSEFVACAAEVNAQLASGFAARCCAGLEDDEESKVAMSEDAHGFRWELPAKTWFRVTQNSALEERRAQLERSLEALLLQLDRRICNLPVLRDFLMLDIFGVQVAEHKNLEAVAHFE